MNIVVPIKIVPDLVEELAIDSSGAALDTSWLRLIINEFDDHAMEQAILLKEQTGGQVTVLALEAEGVDDILFTAAAKGIDRLIKLEAEAGAPINNHALARALAGVIRELQPDLVLTGVQAHNDLDGAVGPLLAEYLGMPYVGYIAGVKQSGDGLTVRKEYPGGLAAEMKIAMPGVLGIQAAEKPPRYVAVSKVRQAMQATKIDARACPALDQEGGLTPSRLYQPQPTERATMIEGDVDTAAGKIIELLKNAGVM
jgi:electron transfer flavoprotein beta subunit